MSSQIRLVKSWIDAAQRVVVLTGAGISTESGIPDFRGPKGVWTSNPTAEKQSTLQHYLADPQVRQAAWQSRLNHPAWLAGPNSGHRAIHQLEQRGKLHALITQNIDGLHQQAGHADDRVIEVHGTMRRVMCWDCGRRLPMPEVLERVRAGEPDPHCLDCGGILKSDTISFGQAMVPEVIEAAFAAAAEADLLAGHRQHAAGLSGGLGGAAGQTGGRAGRDHQQPGHTDGWAGRRGVARCHRDRVAAHLWTLNADHNRPSNEAGGHLHITLCAALHGGSARCLQRPRAWAN